MFNEQSLSLPTLPYEYDELEPWISRDIMEVHHKKHHQGYLTGINKTLYNCKLVSREADLTNLISLQHEIQFFGGGHINHCLFWTSLCPVKNGGGELPKTGFFYEQIIKQFSSFDKLRSEVHQCALSLQGSGWTWLALKNNKIILMNTSNQNTLLPAQGIPLLGIDMWEHAYYLQYKNVKLDYLNGIWNVINWKEVEKRCIKEN